AFLPDIHGPAHHPESVIAVERGDGLARIELDRVPGDAVGGEEIAENAGMLDGEVLKNQEAHEFPPNRASTAAQATPPAERPGDRRPGRGRPAAAARPRSPARQGAPAARRAKRSPRSPR